MYLFLSAQALSGGYRAPCEKQSGLPGAEHSWFQTDPTDPSQGTAEPCRHDGGARGKPGGGREKCWMERGVAQGTLKLAKEEMPDFTLHMAPLSHSTSKHLYL